MSEYKLFGKPLLQQISTAVPRGEGVHEVIYACSMLHGMDNLTPYANGSGSNGNVSYRRRSGKSIITGTGLPSKEHLRPEDLATIEEFGLTNNVIKYSGKKQPSSEALLHLWLALYERANFIVHGHESTELLYPRDGFLWEQLGIVSTANKAQAGTIDLPMSVMDAIKDREQTEKYVVLLDHYPPWDPQHVGIVLMGENFRDTLDRATYVHEGLVSARQPLPKLARI